MLGNEVSSKYLPSVLFIDLLLVLERKVLYEQIFFLRGDATFVIILDNLILSYFSL